MPRLCRLCVGRTTENEAENGWGLFQYEHAGGEIMEVGGG
jgi:hypothetical protein